ncbi:MULTISPECIES: hypothetical protein [Acidobacterium]|uniref:Glycosyl transferase family 2 n=1 Tax=Acidobacterium capsulatum (strain ATCC 51196 / DSM 11244 / BCRC 80197 / JCM 7670 / NBRC 15755 / NCIMB 13165 / 161) TaxID=240015 RepID=C1F2U2_ACIC5|nr:MULTISPECIES: hypothetical protein [Acidobacterium]ACO31479.1 conserved hypothetical protein [Acidobacterium capsulatum ATCC 51196]HCT60084.1 hypothetical protein [Acidobacterium sp.]
MAEAEVLEETGSGVGQQAAVDLLIGVTGAVSLDELRARVSEVLAQIGRPGPGRVVVAWPGGEDATPVEPGDGFELMPYRVPAVNDGGAWAQISAAQRGVLALAAELKAAACVVLAADLEALHGEAVQTMAGAVLARQCDLALPVYAITRYEGLLNTAILAPMSRALYARRVEFPLPFEFAASGRYAECVARTHGASAQSVLWPLSHAVQEPMPRNAGVCQVHLRAHHHAPMEGLDLTAVLSQIVGAFFTEVELTAASWQRLRGSQPAPVWGEPHAPVMAEEAVDARPMVESFQLAARNLGELWSLVLPPVALLELKRLARQPVESFRMPDALWARMVYDFALAHRLRTIGRSHLMGALTPLYLGWVASYVQEIALLPAAEVAERQERLARAFEENKPYLVSRWRWPDRFNP